MLRFSIVACILAIIAFLDCSIFCALMDHLVYMHKVLPVIGRPIDYVMQFLLVLVATTFMLMITVAGICFSRMLYND